MGAEDHISWEYREDPVALVRELKIQGHQIVLLEQMAGSVSHDVFEPKAPVCLVIGNEISGVSQELAALSDAAIEIEMTGIKNSLNVAVAFGVAAYHIRAGIKKIRRTCTPQRES